MTEIDLVPAAYRRWLVLRRAALVFALLTGLLVAGAVAARVVLTGNVGALAAQLAELRDREQALHTRQARLDALREREEALAARVAVLDRLRGGLPSMAVFRAVDRALDKRVWFRDWSFRRAGEYVPAQGARVAGADVIVLADPLDGGTPRAWKMETHMEIQGQALDHSALADFVPRLGSQAVVREGRVVDTQVRRYTQTHVVDFRLAVILAAGAAL